MLIHIDRTTAASQNQKSRRVVSIRQSLRLLETFSDGISGDRDHDVGSKVLSRFFVGQADDVGGSGQPTGCSSRYDVLLQKNEWNLLTTRGASCWCTCVSTKTDDQRCLLTLQKITSHPGSPLLPAVELPEPADRTGQGAAGKTTVRKSGRMHLHPIERLSVTAECNAYIRQMGAQLFRNCQTGEQMSARATSGKDDVHWAGNR